MVMAESSKLVRWKIPDWLITFFWLLMVAAVWSAAVRLLEIPDYILPSPENVVGWISSRPGYFLDATVSTLQVIAVGFSAGVAAAVPMGLALAKMPWLERSLYPFVVFLQTMPLIAITPALVIWFGYGLVPSSILVGFSVFFPVLVNAFAGIRSIPAPLYFVARTMGANFLQTFRYIDWPMTLPHLMSAFRICLALATTTAVVSEFIAANEGLGFAALRGVRNRDPVQVIAVVLIAAVVGVLLNGLSLLLEQRIMRKYRG
ncbi:ABC transporter permease [Mesorhizobium sp. LNJC405B00]|uniref:ABC transporter permease n=1 Tax=Mesorhizobium sp. LNJC405B00 TaxID=1287281 RepID=UPI000AB048F6|nr:ABC transporter permease [Mesorhizobium sp. LNJC405B00]